ncbi:Pentatricopeptide repeat-containing protein, partial [Cucurbita argyrosperma subsp. argyrosperma]
MIENGVNPDRATYSSLINGHVSQDNMKDAFRFHDEMLQRGLGYFISDPKLGADAFTLMLSLQLLRIEALDILWAIVSCQPEYRIAHISLFVVIRRNQST